MSLTVLLVPLAIAAATGAFSLRDDGLSDDLAANTRMADRDLLVEALSLLGYTVVGETAELTAARDDVKLDLAPGHMVQDASVYVVRSSGRDLDRGRFQAIIEEIDTEYLRLLQNRVYDRVREHAHEHGMSVLSTEVEDDRSVVLTLEVHA